MKKLILLSVLTGTVCCSLKALEEKKLHVDGIASYNNQRDAAEVQAIAMESMPYLVSTMRHDANTYKMLFDQCIKPIMNDPHHASTVFLKDNKAVGFINYGIGKPWHRHGSYGKLFHLAVAKKNRNNGYGNFLMRSALHDLQTKNVDYVDLMTTPKGTGTQLDTFYKSFGFTHLDTSRRFESEYRLRFKPHPLHGFAQQCLRYIKKI